MDQKTQNIVIGVIVALVVFGGGGFALGASQTSHEKDLVSQAQAAEAKAKAGESDAMKKEATATAMQKEAEADAMKKDEAAKAASTTGDAMAHDTSTTDTTQ